MSSDQRTARIGRNTRALSRVFLATSVFFVGYIVFLIAFNPLSLHPTEPLRWFFTHGSTAVYLALAAASVFYVYRLSKELGLIGVSWGMATGACALTFVFLPLLPAVLSSRGRKVLKENGIPCGRLGPELRQLKAIEDLQAPSGFD